MGLREAAEQAWLALQRDATDSARARLEAVLAPYSVSTLEVAAVDVGPGYRLVVFTDGDVYVAVREGSVGEPEVFLVHSEGAGWAIDSSVTSLAGLYEALPPVTTAPPWEVGVAVAAGERRVYGSKTYEAVQSHTTQADWTPDVTPALWKVVG